MVLLWALPNSTNYYGHCIVLGIVSFVCNRKSHKLSLSCHKVKMQSTRGGGLSPKALPKSSCETLRFKPLRAIIVLGWVTFLALEFQGTLPPMICPIIVGKLGEPYIQLTMWESRGLLVGETCVGMLVRARTKCSPPKEGHRSLGTL